VATGRWTLEEDANLTSAVANTSKKKWGKEYKTDWAAVAALVLGRTSDQCYHRWDNFLDSSIDQANERTGKWTEDEDSKLMGAVQTYGGKNWNKIAELVPGRTKSQCCSRWKDVLDPSIGRANGRTSNWTAVEDSKLKDAVQTHGGKKWGAISALVPGRTKMQCKNRWHGALNPNSNLTGGRTGKWEEDEDSKLKDAMRRHGARIRSQFPRWFRVEREDSVVTDG
jgi:myb proto-oncogene protein